MSHRRLAAMLTDDELAAELRLVRLEMGASGIDDEDRSLDRLFDALVMEAARRWWLEHQPPQNLFTGEPA